MVKYSKLTATLSDDALNNILKYSSDPEIISFSLGSPAKEVYPVEEIKEITSYLFDNNATQILSYGLSEGYEPLKNAYIEHIAKPKGLEVGLDNLIVTTGSSQGIDLVAQSFIDPNDVILVEAPTFFSSLSVFQKYGAKLVSVATDEQGIIIDDLIEKVKLYKPKILYTIPTFQNPSGKTLPVDRRKEIAKLAAQFDFVVLEDDPYCDLRYSGEAVPSIISFDQAGRVILANSFSKILAPGLRVGILVASKEIIKRLVLGKGISDTNTTILAQAICAEFLNRGLLPNHLEEMKPLYKERLDTAIKCIKEHFPSGTKYTVPEGGLFIWVDLPSSIDTEKLLPKIAADYKVSYVSGCPFFINPEDGKSSMRINFSSNTPSKLKEGLRRLGDALKKEI